MALKINNLIPGPESYSDSNMIIKFIDPTNLIKLYRNNIVSIPNFQRDLEQDKIIEIKNKIVATSSNWILTQGRLCLGFIDLSFESKFYILDGQHRLKSLELLLNEKPNYKLPIEIIIIKFRDGNHMKDHFRSININSQIEPIYLYFDNSVIQSSILAVKKFLKDDYGSAFRKPINKSDNNHNYHLSEYIALFSPEIIKKYYDDNNDDYSNYQILLDRIVLVNELVKDIFNDLQIQNKRQNYILDKDYDKCRDNNFYLAYDFINSVKYILDIDIELKISCLFKPKIKINKKMRSDVWKKRNNNCMIGSCFTCEKILDYESSHAGHIISEANGGLTILSNLEPICSTCNTTMGTKNLLDFKQDLRNFRNIIVL